jgi:hypothetical protein
MTTRDKLINAAALLAFFGLFALSKVYAQGDIRLAGNPVVDMENGAPLPGSVTYVFEKQDGAGWIQVATASVPAFTHTGQPPGEHCYQMRASVNGVTSDPSNTACKTVLPEPAPDPVPAGPVVIPVIEGMGYAPVYKLTQTNKRDQAYKDACGYIEVGAACTGPVVYEYRGKKFRKVSESDVKPAGVTCSGNVVAPCQ